MPHATHAHATETFDGRAFRGVMSHWATGVAVVTTMTPDGPTGCTMNAMTSLSLDPLELLVCFDRTSDTLIASRTHQRFCVNVLAADQHPISTRFARKGTPQEKFDGISYTLDQGAPAIDGCIANIVCEIQRVLDGGDHEIVIGRPLAGAFADEPEPLIFFKNHYGRLHVSTS